MLCNLIFAFMYMVANENKTEQFFGEYSSQSLLCFCYFAANYRVILPCGSLLALGLEGCAVGALRHGGVALVSNDLNL